MFKEKTSKKRQNNNNNLKDNHTLDVIHNKMIKTFYEHNNEKVKHEKILNELILIQEVLKTRIETLSDQEDKNIEYSDLWTSNIDITEKIIQIKNKLKENSDFDEIEYYKKTSDILFNYYDMIEKQSKIVKVNNNTTKFHNKTILDALHNIKQDTKPIEEPSSKPI